MRAIRNRRSAGWDSWRPSRLRTLWPGHLATSLLPIRPGNPLGLWRADPEPVQFRHHGYEFRPSALVGDVCRRAVVARSGQAPVHHAEPPGGRLLAVAVVGIGIAA